MAEFLGVTTDAPALQTAVTPKAGIESTASAQATEDTARAITGFVKPAVDLLAGLSASRGNTVLNAFSLDLIRLGDATDQGAIKPREARSRARELLTAFTVQNPGQAEAGRKLFGESLDQAGLAKVLTEQSNEERRDQTEADNAFAAGHINEDGTPNVASFREENELERRAKSVRDRLAILTSKQSLDTGAIGQKQAQLNLDQDLLQIEARNLLTDTAGNRSEVLNTRLKDIAKRSASGEIDANVTAASLQELRTNIENSINQSAGIAGIDFAKALARPLLSQVDAYEEIISGGKITAALQEKLDRALIETKINMIVKEPDLLAIMALSETFRNIPLELLPRVNALMARFMADMVPGTDGEGLGKVRLTDPDNQGVVSDYLAILRSVFSNSDPENEALTQSNNDNLTSVLKSLDVFSNAVDKTSEYKNAAEFIASSEVGKQLVEQGGVPVEVLTKASELFTTQYNQVLLPMIRQQWLDATVIAKSRFSADKKSITSVIEPVFSGSGVVFRLSEGLDAETRQSAIAALEILNGDTAKVLNQVIRIDAHLSGTLNYQKVYDARYKDLFEVVAKPEEDGGGFTLKKFFEGRAGTGSLFDAAPAGNRPRTGRAANKKRKGEIIIPLDLDDKKKVSEVRPLNPGEFVQNDDGSRSTERTITVTEPSLNGGRPTNIPTIFVVDGNIVELPFTKEGQRKAVELANQSGLDFPSFETIDEAVEFSKNKSASGGRSPGLFNKEEN